jgi:hypothetical protein
VINVEKVRAWPFPVTEQTYDSGELRRIYKGYGGAAAGPLAAFDASFLRANAPEPFPAALIALADGEFWQQNPEAGIDWRRIAHFRESLEVTGVLPPAGRLKVRRRVAELADRGSARGALLVEEQEVSSQVTGVLGVVESHCVLLGDGGFGGPGPVARPRPRLDRETPPDLTLLLQSPSACYPRFLIPADIDLARSAAADGRKMLRGVCAFGVAARAALGALSASSHHQLRRLDVFYTAPLFSDESLMLSLWRTGAHAAVFTLTSIDRDTDVIGPSSIEFS